jgi:Na+-transporting NADH:ubiquinone oxidoreductase subunit A
LLSFLSPKKEYVLDTNLHGEERPFVQTGAMEKVLPMDIYPVVLLKAILANDYDAMEALGIYEVAEEDFALCEFIDVSKNDVQAIIREGLDMMRNS